jgi:cyclopropane fatty-acyl-phospholipid synthase-like methyltransferase
MLEEQYISGEYLEKHPDWHIEESPWKVKHMLPMLKRHHLLPKTICEVGCGAGEVLRLLQNRLDDECILWGYDISPHAMALCQQRANERLHFKLADLRKAQDAFFDLLLALDVIEHVEDYMGFLRDIRTKGTYKLFQIPLEISVQGVLRGKIFLQNRDFFGHLHYFTKETFLRTLRDTGYEVLDYSYAPGYEVHSASLQERLRKFSFAVQQDWTVRMLGGFRLLVLAK